MFELGRGRGSLWLRNLDRIPPEKRRHARWAMFALCFGPTGEFTQQQPETNICAS
jgi:hypothetical protein